MIRLLERLGLDKPLIVLLNVLNDFVVTTTRGVRQHNENLKRIKDANPSNTWQGYLEGKDFLDEMLEEHEKLRRSNSGEH